MKFIFATTVLTSNLKRQEFARKKDFSLQFENAERKH